MIPFYLLPKHIFLESHDYHESPSTITSVQSKVSLGRSMDRFDKLRRRGKHVSIVNIRYSEDSARGFHRPAPEFRPMWRCLLSIISIDTVRMSAVSCTARLTIAGKRSDLEGKVPTLGKVKTCSTTLGS